MTDAKPSDSDDTASPRRRRLMLVDDSAKVGGGQMSLLNYLSQPSLLVREVAFVEAGPLVEAVARTGAAVHVIGAPAGRIRKLLRTAGLFALLRSADPEVVLVNSLRAAIMVSVLPGSSATRLLYVHELVSREWLSRGRLGPLKHRFFERWVLRRFDGLIVNSDATAATVPATVRVPVLRAYPVAGVTGTASAADDVVEAGTSEEPALRVLYLGRIAHWKGVRTLVDAFDELVLQDPGVDVRVTIAGDATYGDPDLLPLLTERANRWPGRFRYAGFVADTRAAFDENDVLFSGSLVPEPFGLGVVQALASGTPVVASRGGGPEEILGASGAGVFFDAGDPVGLAETLRALATDRARLERMRAATSAAAEPFLDEATSSRLDDVVIALDRAARDRRRAP